MKGAGPGNTIITNLLIGNVNNSGSGQMIQLSATAGAVTRISGIEINANKAGGGIYVSGPKFAPFRIDHCTFRNVAVESIPIWSVLAGCIDHCTFVDCYLAMTEYGGADMNTSWQDPLSLGTTNCVVTEDCNFLFYGPWDPWNGSGDIITSGGQGMRRTFRYNHFTNFNANIGFQPLVDAHGNQELVSNNSGSLRGTRQFEMYNNVFVNAAPNPNKGFRMVHLRGGTMCIFNNTYLGSYWDGSWYSQEEDGCSRFNWLSSYPGYDQHWMWIWNNKLNGNTVASLSFAAGCDSTFILPGVNVFWTAPSPTAPGYPVASPAITSYTPLVYPHPLVTAQDGGGTAGNQPPTAIATASVSSGVKPLTVRFTGSASSDPERTLLTYSWNFGDGHTATVADPTNTYANAGSYLAQLTVSDGTNTATAGVNITVLANASGLVAAYGFEEASGTIVSDSSGNSNNGTASAVGRSGSGRFGRAMVFGNGSLVTVPDAASLDATSVTVEAWVYPTNATAGWQNVILKGNPNTVLSYVLNAAEPPNLTPSFFCDIAPSSVPASTALPINTWTHLCGTYDGSTVRVYTNGVLAGSLGQAGAINLSNESLFIGGNPYTGHTFNGLIDEVRVYSRALSPTEIQTDMNTPVLNTGKPPAPGNFHVVVK